MIQWDLMGFNGIYDDLFVPFHGIKNQETMVVLGFHWITRYFTVWHDTGLLQKYDTHNDRSTNVSLYQTNR